MNESVKESDPFVLSITDPPSPPASCEAASINVFVIVRPSLAVTDRAPALPAPENATGAVWIKLSLMVAGPVTSIVTAPPDPTLPSAGLVRIWATFATN